jgi:hypothetical protein
MPELDDVVGAAPPDELVLVVGVVVGVAGVVARVNGFAVWVAGVDVGAAAPDGWVDELEELEPQAATTSAASSSSPAASRRIGLVVVVLMCCSLVFSLGKTSITLTTPRQPFWFPAR